MNRSRLSPITIKRQTQPSSKRRSQTSLDELLLKIQQRLKLIQLNQWSQQHINQLWNILPSLKQAEGQIKSMTESLYEMAGSFSNASPERAQKSGKNTYNASSYNQSRFISNMEREVQHLKNEIQNFKHKKMEIQKQTQNDELRQIQFERQDLNERIVQFKKQLYQAINQSRVSMSNSRLTSDETLQAKIKETPAFGQLQRRKKQYENVIGMLSCMKKTNEDLDMKMKVKQNYEKISKLSGTTNKKVMKDALMDVEKKQTLQKLDLQLVKFNEEILKQGNQLRKEIRQIEEIFGINMELANQRFSMAFIRFENLRIKTLGLIEKFTQDFEKIQEILTFSKPKTYCIQYKDNELTQSHRQFIQMKQKWEDLLQMLRFQYCNY